MLGPGAIERFTETGSSEAESPQSSSRTSAGNRQEDAVPDSKALLPTHSPIHNLPDDVLMEIFFAHRERCEADRMERGSEHRRYSYAYIRVAHVCRHWRTVSLAMATLWNHIITAKDDNSLADTLLALSQTSPLTVDVRPHRTRSAESLRHWVSMNLMPHAHRIHGLVLRTDAVGWSAAMELLRHTDSLRSLTLFSYIHPRNVEPVILKGLKHLKIHGFYVYGTLKCVQVTEALTTTLTSLTLSDSFSTDSTGRSTQVLLAMLRLLPLLSVLRLKQLQLDVGISEEPVHFPNLQELCLTFAKPTHCAWILDHLSFPCHTRLEIKRTLHPITLPQDPLLERCMRKLGSGLNAVDPQGQHTGLRRLELQFQQSSCSIVGWDTVDGPAQFHPTQSVIPARETARLQYDQYWTAPWQSTEPEPTTDAGLRSHSYFLDIEVLRIGHEFVNSLYLKRDDGFQLIHAMRNLRTLCLDSWTEEDVAALISSSSDRDVQSSDDYPRSATEDPELMRHQQTHGQTSDPPVVNLPVLSVVHLYDFRPAAPHSITETVRPGLGEGHVMESQESRPHWDYLYNALRDRETSLGSKLSRLAVEVSDAHEGHLSQRRLGGLRSVVGEFVLVLGGDTL